MTRLRWHILFLLFLAMTINILDRQVLSLVAPELRDQLHLSNTQYGTIVLFFLLGMTVAQIPIGTVMDRLGVRLGYSLVFLWWSAANALHIGARSAAQFSMLRFLLGVGESGTYSGGVKAIGQWFPPEERALAAGLFNSGSLAGAVIAPPLVVYLMLKFGWQSAFLIPSLAGLVWLIPWLKIYREPVRQPRNAGSLDTPVNSAEADGLCYWPQTAPTSGLGRNPDAGLWSAGHEFLLVLAAGVPQTGARHVAGDDWSVGLDADLFGGSRKYRGRLAVR